MEPYFSKHKLREYNNLLMQNTILRTKHKSMELGALDIMFGEIMSKIFSRRIYMVCLKNTKQMKPSIRGNSKSIRKPIHICYESFFVIPKNNFV
jgi:hypothetical protein